MQRVKSAGSTFWATVNRSQSNQSREDQIRTAMAGFALLFILLPWMPVGPSGSMAGSALVGHGVFNDAIGVWLKENPLGTLLFVVTPALTVGLSFFSLIEIFRKRNPVLAHLIIVVLPLLTLKLASYPILDNPVNTVFGVPVPQIGLLHLVVIHFGLLLYGLHLKYKPVLRRLWGQP